MKFLRLAAILLCVSLVLAGCGGKIQSDLKLEDARFSVDERGVAQFSGTVKNTGNATYKSVTVVVDAYENDTYVMQLATQANLPGSNTLGPGKSTGFSKGFEDGGAKPTRYEVVRLYGTQ